MEKPPQLARIEERDRSGYKDRDLVIRTSVMILNTTKDILQFGWVGTPVLAVRNLEVVVLGIRSDSLDRLGCVAHGAAKHDKNQ